VSANPLIFVVDAGAGNLRSVQKALEHCGARVTLAAAPEALRNAAKIVLPGVGAFGDFMNRLRASGMDQALRQAWQAGAPVLGICVGMQALFEASEEMGHHQGLGWLPGRVVRFPAQQGLKVPHTGWNRLLPRRPDPLLAGLPPEAYAYFNHSYYCRAENPDHVLAVTDHGLTFASVVQRDHLFGVQFHPEKSQAVGLRILRNFVVWKA